MRFFIRRNNLSGMLRHSLGAAALMITAVAPVSAKEKPGDSAMSARDVFERLSSPALEVLTPSARLDMLDYWDVDSVYQVKNALNGRSWLTEVAPDMVSLNITPVSTLSIKLLPVKGGTVAMTVYTVGGDGQARDSQVDFYDVATLQPVDGSRYFTAPALKDFFEVPKGSDVTIMDIEEIIPFMTVEYSVKPGSDEVSAHLTSPQFMGKEGRDKVEPLLKADLKAPWKGRYIFK